MRKERETLAASRQRGMQGVVEDEANALRLGGSLVIFGVGVDSYANYPNLKYASRDCQRLMGLFKSRYGLPESHVMILTNEAATAVKVKRFIEQDAAKLLQPDDTFVFYFAGHGAPDVDASSLKEDGMKKYLLFNNTEPMTMPLTATSLDDLADSMRKLPCKRVLVFLDSCFAGTAGKNTLSRLRGLRICDRTYKDMTDISGRGRVVMAACSENQVSQENTALEAGVFTQSLIEGLEGKADGDRNGRVDILELFNYTTKRVGELTNQSQTPVFRGTLDRKIEF
jgi:uncharacterized caspase-like protein